MLHAPWRCQHSRFASVIAWGGGSDLDRCPLRDGIGTVCTGHGNPWGPLGSWCVPCAAALVRMQPTFVAWRRPSIGCQPTLGGWCSSCRFLNPAFGGEGDRPRQVRPSVQFITGSARAFKAGPLASSERISGPTSSVPSPGTARHQDRCRSRRERVCYCSNLHCYRARSLDPTRRATAHTAPPRERPQLAAATPRRWRRAWLKSPKLRPLVPVVGSVTEWPGRSPAENLCHCALGGDAKRAKSLR